MKKIFYLLIIGDCLLKSVVESYYLCSILISYQIQIHKLLYGPTFSPLMAHNSWEFMFGQLVNIPVHYTICINPLSAFQIDIFTTSINYLYFKA